MLSRFKAASAEEKSCDIGLVHGIRQQRRRNDAIFDHGHQICAAKRLEPMDLSGASLRILLFLLSSDLDCFEASVVPTLGLCRFI